MKVQVKNPPILNHGKLFPLSRSPMIHVRYSSPQVKQHPKREAVVEHQSPPVYGKNLPKKVSFRLLDVSQKSIFFFDSFSIVINCFSNEVLLIVIN